MKTPRKRSPKPARRRPASGIPRLSSRDGLWYWKPSAHLRPAFTTVALGEDRRLAEAEAIRLNRQVEAWRTSPARTPAARPKGRSGPASVGMLIAAYQNSADWKRLAARTRVTYDHELGVLAARFADDLAATLSFRTIDDWLDELRMRSPDTARHVVARGRALFNWAARKEMIPPSNPFAKARAPAPRRRSVRMTWDDVRQLVATADVMGYPSVGSALVVCFACVQRITDVIALERRHLAGGRLVFRQHKSERRLSAHRVEPGKQIDMDLPAVVRERLAAAAAGDDGGPLLICETTGRPWHEKTIGRVFGRIVAAARKERPAIPADAQLRDGRRSGFVHYVTNGASIPWVCSISGHSIEEGYEIVEHYLPRTAENADQAVALFRAAW